MGTFALLTDPRGIAIDKSGNIIIAERGTTKIRQISSSNNLVTVVCGDTSIGTYGGYANGVGRLARFNSPWGMVMTAENVLFVGDGSSLRKVVSEQPSAYPR